MYNVKMLPYCNDRLGSSLPLIFGTPSLFIGAINPIIHSFRSLDAKMKRLQKSANSDNYLLANCDIKYAPLIGQVILFPLALCIDNSPRMLITKRLRQIRIAINGAIKMTPNVESFSLSDLTWERSRAASTFQQVSTQQTIGMSQLENRSCNFNPIISLFVLVLL